MDAVIFDIDGTLLHSIEIDETLFHQAISLAIDDVNIRPLFSDYEHVTDSGIVSQIIRENSVENAAETIAKIRSCFIDMLSEHVTSNGPFEQISGARNYVQKLIESDQHAVAIATGGWRESAHLKLGSAGFADLDIPIATSDDAIARVDIMKFALSKLSGSFNSVTYYGDGEWDQRATAELGWHFVPVGAKLGGLTSYEE
ncbi:MAG: HAD family hydrolase [Woeseiaceae bacterium]